MFPVTQSEISTKMLPWLQEGYATVAADGPLALRVEPLARAVGKNKSSFYHHFADLEVFTEWLLTYHLQRARLMAEKESRCQTIDELITVILDHKTDLLFHRQLRFHRDRPDFDACLEQTATEVVVAIIPLWSKTLGLDPRAELTEMVLNLSIENFYLQINDHTLNREWLTDYFDQLRHMVDQFRRGRGVVK